MTTLWLTQELTGSILDVGGGGEGVIGRLYGPSVTIIDHCQEELDEAPCSCPKLLMDAASLAFTDASFENVTFFYSLMYMNRPVQKAALVEAVRVLKPGGRLLLWDCEIACAYPERAGRSLGAGTSLHHLRRCKIRPAIHGRFPEPVPGKRIDAFENGNRQRTFLSGISEIKNRRACFFQQTRL